MPCYRCGARQSDPEPGKPSPWQRAVVAEHQVLICPDCRPAALADLTRCPGCDSVRLVRRLDQVECLDCRLTRDAADTAADPAAVHPAGQGAGPAGQDTGLAAEVARALGRILGGA